MATNTTSPSASAATAPAVDTKSADKSDVKSTDKKMPVLFLSHGPGPGFFMTESSGFFSAVNAKSAATAWYKSVASKYLADYPKPRAIVVISAHWETDEKLSVYSMDKNSLYFDYYGFPGYTYQLQWPAPGSQKVAAEVQKALSAAGLPCDVERKRGLDHGVFIPLKLIYPDADIPTLQLSLLSNLDPATHIKIGQALAPLRDQGVLIIGSGQATHGRPNASKPNYAVPFDTWLSNTLTKDTPQEREAKLLKWQQAPAATQVHPREEHLIPVHVAVGAAGTDKGKQIYSSFDINFLSLACYKFG